MPAVEELGLYGIGDGVNDGGTVRDVMEGSKQRRKQLGATVGASGAMGAVTDFEKTEVRALVCGEIFTTVWTMSTAPDLRAELGGARIIHFGVGGATMGAFHDYILSYDY